MDIVAAKRIKFDTTVEDALNLSLAATEPPPQTAPAPLNDLTEMRRRFQQWVIETYRDSSKTKTITTKKYERILKTLAGEIKNCAENSKFRFWMKCKGFKLEIPPGGGNEKLLLVQDKKGDEIKYKKVAVVENFFDIIYNVHVNEGARGIQHAGQKRTHRTITETYAFLPREAVTKFLLCCAECQKRTYDERKISPNSSSCDSSHERHEMSSVPSISTTTENTSTCSQQPFQIPMVYKEKDCEYWNKITTRTDYDNNNCVNDNLDEPYNFCIKQLTPILNPNDIIRKRKRKFTRKLVRSAVVESQDVEFDARRIEHEESRTSATDVHKIPENYTSTPGMSGFENTNSFLNYENHPNPFEKFKTEVNKENAPTDLDSCPYLFKLSRLLIDPARYAEENERNNLTSLNEDFLEQLAVNLIAKAQRLERVKNILTDHEKQQLSLKVYSCRISSFLLNYAADLMLKSVVID